MKIFKRIALLLLISSLLTLLVNCGKQGQVHETTASHASADGTPEQDGEVMKSLSMPLLSIELACPLDKVDRSSYVSGRLTLEGCDSKYRLTDFEIEMRGRGNGSWTHEKKCYKLKLSEKADLLGISGSADRDWVLIANHCDRTMLRNALATYVQERMSAIDYVPSYAFVELSVNGEYRGVYQLYESIEANGHKVDLEGDSEGKGFLVEMSKYAEKSDYPFLIDGKYYEVCSDLPEERNEARKTVDDAAAYMTECYNAVLSGDRTKIESLIDIDSAVDVYIVEEFMKNLDAGWDSFYFTRRSGGKLIFGPIWDFDLSAGNANADNGSPIYDQLPRADSLYVGNPLATDRQSNPWLIALMKQAWFQELVKARWQEVSPSMHTLPELIRSTADYYAPSMLRNFERWKIFNGKRISRESDIVLTLDSYAEQIEFLANWISERADWLDGEWGNE